MNYFTECLICNSEKLQDLEDYRDTYLCKCKACGFKFVRRIPSQDELLKHYSNYPRHNHISDITLKRMGELLSSFDRFRKTNNILEVGAGDGHFIGLAKQHGWNGVYATEFDDEAVKNVRQKGVKTHQGKLDPDNYELGSFDMIIFAGVLEHINNPDEEIGNFNKLLRPGGAVHVTTPNIRSLSHFILGSKWNVIQYPEHLSYYNPKTIKKLFKERGFDEIKLTTTIFSISRYMVSSGKAKSFTFNVDQELRKKSERMSLWRLGKLVANGVLDLTKTGDEITALYMKKA